MKRENNGTIALKLFGETEEEALQFSSFTQ